VSSNGFISFDNRSQPSPTPSDIPSTSKPNALIAAVWSDLNVDSNSSIITGFWIFSSYEYYVIIWKNVLHKASGNRLTFEIILENAPQYYPADRRYSQSRIWISYKDVSSINTEFTYGIEDQQGAKGLGGLCSGSSLEYFKGYTIEFYQSSNSYFLKRLTLTFQDTNPNTQFDIREGGNGYYLRGHNIRPNWNQPWEPDYTYMFLKALAGTATLLIGAWSLVADPPAWVVAGGFIVDTILVTTDWADILAYNQISGRAIDVFDMNDGLWQKANATALTYDYVVDASLSLVVHWILRTPNDAGTHSLTITATAEYYEYSIQTGEIIPKDPISTSVNLKIGPDDNGDLDSADEISTGWHYRLYIGGYDMDDYYKIYVDEGYRIYVYIDEISYPDDIANVRLHLYDPSETWKTSVTLEPPPSHTYLEFTADSSGYWFIRVELLAGSAFYNLYVNISEPNLVTILNELGFTNVENSTTETFGPGVYEVRLYAEFAGYHESNNLSWYSIGTNNYNLIFSGEDGGFGYIDPPITKTFTANTEFGLSFCSPEARYFTETSKNPDSLKHAQVYVNLDNPDMYLIGFENQLGVEADRDFNDMVISLEIVNRPPNTPSRPSGPTSGYTGSSYTYSTSATDPDGDDLYYIFSWGDGSTKTIGPCPSGATVFASHTWSSAGTYYVKVRAKDINGLLSDWSQSLMVTISSGGGGGGGGGCPTLFSWNGTAFAEEALLDIHASQDVTVDYTLKHLRPVGRLCMLQLRELDNFTSHIDQVKLYAVDGEGNWHECRLILAWHNRLGPVTTELLYDDGVRVDLTPQQKIQLIFLVLNGIDDIQSFVFELNGYNMKIP